MIQSQIVLHRFEAVVPCGLGSAQIRPSGGTVSPPRVPVRTSDATIISRAVHNSTTVLRYCRRTGWAVILSITDTSQKKWDTAACMFTESPWTFAGFATQLELPCEWLKCGTGSLGANMRSVPRYFWRVRPPDSCKVPKRHITPFDPAVKAAPPSIPSQHRVLSVPTVQYGRSILNKLPK